VLLPDLKTVEIGLKQTGAGQYEASAPFDEPGTYLVTLSAQEDLRPVGQITTGLVVAYSPEYRSGGLNLDLLERLSALTRPRAESSGVLDQPADAFAHTIPAAPGTRELWQALLVAAALFFPLDVAVRRLNLTRRDGQLARAWLTSRLVRPAAGRAAGEPRRLEALFRARGRARGRTEAVRPPQSQGPSSPAEPPAPPQERVPPPAAPPAADSLARLREAKKRAGQGKPK
jgi:hypothetical protein